MPKPSKQGKKTGKAIMLGIGLDSDGHKRITTGPNFAVAGGKQETHEQMTEKVIKINEKLAAKASASKKSAARNSMTSPTRSACAARRRSKSFGIGQ